MPAFTAYAASKAAVRSFARGWTVELKDSQDSCEFDEPWPNRNSGFGESGPHRLNMVEQAAASSPRKFRSVAEASPKKSRLPSCSSLPMKVHTSPA